MARVTAAFYHFLISAVVFAGLAYLILFVWYPDFFFALDGGWEGLRIIIGVDLVLGPLLTLVVFKSGKPGLKMDLALIGLFQSICLSAGTYVVYSERPTFFIYYEEHFYSSNQDTFTRYGRPPADPANYSTKTPAMVYIDLPNNAIEEADLRAILFKDGIPLWVYEPGYRSLEEKMDIVVNEGISEAEMRARDEAGNLDLWLIKNQGSFSDFAFIPIHSRYRDAYLGIRVDSKEIIDIVEIPPPLG
jgi:hypothetical protein